MSKVESLFLQVNNVRVLTAIVVILVSFSIPVSAAFCSLRDPIFAIHSLYPEATKHRSIIRPIDQQMRREVSERLPFTIHHNEIGKHTLYQVLDGSNSIGFVQARSELSEWGLIEIAWAISPNMKIEGLAFQRCRSFECNDTLINEVEAVLQGKSFSELLLLISADGQGLSEHAQGVFSKNSAMHLLILSSALKTLAITELAWGDVISAQLQ
ncbi:hypothetical protein [Neptunomonas japonica]|uniref:Uncharacterized protein n=1 Tax=Neptunomonas japonica JAMM 1380 TaxID=1441457 RepID=A0A7R6SX63_9GAMM|nr:hypothetical protein [Neptunomonas japonica]BBB31210.1 conserved hypothetical protein [Neptunomonas japonica JAMM 1380]